MQKYDNHAQTIGNILKIFDILIDTELTQPRKNQTQDFFINSLAEAKI